MNKNEIRVIIMAGGIGSRFWPISKQNKPKQFLDILGTGQTMLQECFDRYCHITHASNIYIVTNHAYKDLILEQLPQVTEQQVMSEPFGKNTAACVAYAAYKFSAEHENIKLIVAPSDHIIIDRNAFYEYINTALEFADANKALLTLGIKPHRPDTGYGYIQFNPDETSRGINEVITFTEKPPLATAKDFLESGDFLWNSGMFVWRADAILDSFHQFLPEMALAFAEVQGAYNTPKEFQEISRIYAQIASISIDNGILEKADNVYVLPAEFGWSDLGTWKSVQEHTSPNDENYTINVDLHSIDSQNNLVVSDKHKLVVIQGLNDYFIIDSENALLICQNNYEQEIKKINSDIKKKYKDKYN